MVVRVGMFGVCCFLGCIFFLSLASLSGLVTLSLSNSINVFSSFIKVIIAKWVIPLFWIELFVGLETFS